MPDKTSLRALIQDRKAKQTRPTYRHLLTLAPDLYGEREDLEQALSDLPARRPVTSEGAQVARSVSADKRRGELERELAALDERIAAATVTVVFKAPTADAMAAKVAEWQKGKVDTLDQARDLILVCFDRFDTDEELTGDDLAELLPALTQGETYSISNTLSALAVGEIDVPLSVRRSLAARRSAGT